MLDILDLAIPGVRLLSPKRFVDGRGFFSEVFNKRAMSDIGIEEEFVQDNYSLSKDQGTVRGLHFQIDPHPIAKLVRVTRGAVRDVVVDLRHGSPAFGQHVSIELSASNWTQIYVPTGVAHGFCTLQPNTEVAYKVTDYWSAEVDKGLAWDDPDLGIDWPLSAHSAVVSDKDRAQPRLSELPAYFQWEQP